MEPAPQAQELEEGVPAESPAAASAVEAPAAAPVEQQWCHTRYGCWQDAQHCEPGLGVALLRLALASLLQPRLAANAPTGDLPGDVVGAVGEAVSHAIGFIGVLPGHASNVTSALFSADGHKIASASEDGTVRVWSATTGECERTLAGHTHRVVSAASYCPAGQKIVSASMDTTVRIWSAVTGECEQTLTGHTRSVNSAVFAPDGLKVASASSDGSVRIWSVLTGECQQTLTGHLGPVRSASFSPDGQKIVSSSGDQTIRVWRMVR